MKIALPFIDLLNNNRFTIISTVRYYVLTLLLYRVDRGVQFAATVKVTGAAAEGYTS